MINNRNVCERRDTYISFRMKFYKEFLPLEAELPNLGPGEGVDLGAGLEHEDTKVGHC